MGYSYGSGRTGLYRSRDGILFGICRGIADYFFWTRVIVVVSFILTGFFPVGAAYLLAVLLMKPEPRYRY